MLEKELREKLKNAKNNPDGIYSISGGDLYYAYFLGRKDYAIQISQSIEKLMSDKKELVKGEL
ncbi:MAG: hypothetical protein PHE15_06975 [Dehalococcoidales bacterium]|nr:hypothetical protein [Dehalococcoidales bacterium]